jgi:hypothetical protein
MANHTVIPKASIAQLPTKGDLRVWGNNDSDQLRDKPLGKFLAVARGGKQQSVAIREDRTLVLWGDKGLDGIDNALKPPPSGTFKEAVIGISLAMGLATDGTPKPWGKFLASLKPIAPPASVIGRATAIAVGADFALAVAGGHIVAWGEIAGTPADGGYGPIAARHDLAVAIQDNGTGAGGPLVGWGGSTMFPSNPAEAVLLRGEWTRRGDGTYINPGPFLSVAIGNSQTVVAIASDGTLHGWGPNTYDEYTAPNNVLFRAVAVAAGSRFSVGIDTDGYLHYMGSVGDARQYIGIESGTSHADPLPQVPLGRFSSISAGAAHALAVADHSFPASGPFEDR